MVQNFCSHLQDVLKDQTSLRQRLMRPVGRTNLPVQAQLHRYRVRLEDVLVTWMLICVLLSLERSCAGPTSVLL